MTVWRIKSPGPTTFSLEASHGVRWAARPAIAFARVRGRRNQQQVANVGVGANPTWSTRFVMHALEVAQQVAAIVPVPWQCGQGRRELLFKPRPPVWVLALGDRPSMPPGGTDIEAKGGTTDYCWLLWERGFAGITSWRSI